MEVVLNQNVAVRLSLETITPVAKQWWKHATGVVFGQSNDFIDDGAKPSLKPPS